MNDADMLEAALDEFARQGFNVLEHRAALAQMVEELSSPLFAHIKAERDHLQDQLAEAERAHLDFVADATQKLRQVNNDLAEADANGLRLAEENETYEIGNQQLEAEVERLRAALESIANGHIGMDRDPAQHCTDLVRRARQALEGSTSEARS